MINKENDYQQVFQKQRRLLKCASLRFRLIGVQINKSRTGKALRSPPQRLQTDWNWERTAGCQANPLGNNTLLSPAIGGKCPGKLGCINLQAGGDSEDCRRSGSHSERQQYADKI